MPLFAVAAGVKDWEGGLAAAFGGDEGVGFLRGAEEAPRHEAGDVSDMLTTGSG
jgi:hypothetical protein